MNLKYLNKLTKIILGIVTVLVIAVVAGININFNSQKSDLSAVSLANVEALANGEAPGGVMKYVCQYLGCCGGEKKCVTLEAGFMGLEVAMTFYMD